jgi:hypothetical protein
LTERGGQRVLFSGDVIMSLSGNPEARSPYARSLGTYTAYLAPRYRGDAWAFLATLRSLRAFPAPDLVLPGHPRNDISPQSPAMTQSRWEALLDGGIREMEHLLERYDRDGALFLDDTPKRLLPGLYYLGDFHGVAVYGLFASSRFFLVNAPGGPGLSAFVKARLKRLGLEPIPPSSVLLTSRSGEETEGIADLLRTWPCCVVAPDAARLSFELASPAGTSIIGPEELCRRSWLDVKPIVPVGRTIKSIAYLVRWEGKSVLFSGRIPTKPTRAVRQQALREIALSLGDSSELRGALAQLRKINPDLWLPVFSTDCQNANLEPGDWTILLAQNEELLR